MIIRDMRAARGDPRTRRRHRWGRRADLRPVTGGSGAAWTSVRGPGPSWSGRVVRAGLGRTARIGSSRHGGGGPVSGHGTGRRSGRVGVRRVLPIGAAGLLAVGTVLMVSTTPQSAGVTGLAAERIDLTLPGVPIRVASSFGTAAGTGPADSATGDRAVAAVLADVQDFWSIQLSGNGGSGLTPLAGGVVSMDSTQPGGPALCITDPAQITGNAFYCPQGDGIVYDSSALVPVLLGRYGSC